MASSTCVKCGSGSFELKHAAPSGSAFNLCFVQCSSCGGVIGVMEATNINAVLVKQNKAIAEIAQRVGAYVDLS